MEAIERSPRLEAGGTAWITVAWRRLPDLGVWVASCALVLYLALSNGGYDVIGRSEAGIVVWWIVLVGTAVGALPVAGGTRAGRLMLVLLAAFAAWTVLSLAWTESTERTVIETGRVATYLGFFALALAVQRQGRWRYLFHGLTAGVGIVATLAVLSRLQPTWFPEQEAHTVFPSLEGRLLYPLNYPSGLAAFVAIGLPLMLGATAAARTLPMQALAAAALPVSVLALWLTGSSQALPLSAGGLLVFMILAPDRLPKLGTLALAGAGSAILIVAQEQRDALDRGLTTPLAQQQGDELLVFCVIVCAGVALAQTAIGLAVRHGRRPAWLSPSRPQTAVATGAAIVVAVPLALAAGATGELSKGWESFKAPPAPASESRVGQILDVSSNRRFDYWKSAIDANRTRPLLGIGPGTFEFWWAREGGDVFIRDAHSLYFETLAESGIIGLLLIIGFTGGVLAIGAARAFRAPPTLRLVLAASTAGCVIFAASALVDWMWELGAIAAVFMGLAAIAVAGGATPRDPEASRRLSRSSSTGSTASAGWALTGRIPGGRAITRVAFVALSALALIAIVIPLAGTRALSDSRLAASQNDLSAALEHARNAASIQPYAASAHLQEALILERRGNIPAALDAAREAASNESTNWRTWLIVSRLQARAGNAQASVAAYREARSLYPKGAGLRPGQP